MDFYGERLMAADKKAMTTLTTGEHAVELVKLTDAEYAKIQELSKPSLEKWKADAAAVGMDGDALLQELLGLIDKWTGIMESEGLPWERG